MISSVAEDREDEEGRDAISIQDSVQPAGQLAWSVPTMRVCCALPSERCLAGASMERRGAMTSCVGSTAESCYAREQRLSGIVGSLLDLRWPGRLPKSRDEVKEASSNSKLSEPVTPVRGVVGLLSRARAPP